jgi:hypothetical protein
MQMHPRISDLRTALEQTQHRELAEYRWDNTELAKVEWTAPRELGYQDDSFMDELHGTQLRFDGIAGVVGSF